MEVKITSAGIKQAIDDLYNEKEQLQNEIYDLNDKLKEINNIIRKYSYSESKYVNEKRIHIETKVAIPEDGYLRLLELTKEGEKYVKDKDKGN